MRERIGRWMLIHYSFPSRSKAQRDSATGFQKWLVSNGYRQISSNAAIRFLPNPGATKAEFVRITNASPQIGTVVAVDISDAEYRRGLWLQNGMAVPPDPHPELLTVY
ncbi:MAG: hypothetical protein FWG25_05320 [Promicromonosporaceae bacterium]|nr:hypothetical protein [Promicromonosporaceae bacterium]